MLSRFYPNCRVQAGLSTVFARCSAAVTVKDDSTGQIVKASGIVLAYSSHCTSIFPAYTLSVNAGY